MAARTRFLSLLGGCVAALLALMILTPMGCGGGGGSGGNSGGDTFRTLNMTVNSLGKNVRLSAGQSTTVDFVLPINLAASNGPIDGLKLDLQAHLDNAVVSIPGIVPDGGDGRAVADNTAEMSMRIGPAEMENTVCSDGELYGPFTVSVDSQMQPADVSPGAATANQATVDVINTGFAAICVTVESAIDATVDLDQISVEVSNCDDPPADIDGVWIGSYSCGAPCPESGDITLTITQNSEDPSFASYTDDGGASYEGRVCGNRFSFEGGEENNYDESGTFVLNADGSGSKNSTYNDGACVARCTDSLNRL